MRNNSTNRRPHPNGTASSVSFDTASDLENESRSSMGCRSPNNGSVYMVGKCASDEHAKYLSPGITELEDAGKDCVHDSYWSNKNITSKENNNGESEKQSKRPYKRDAIDKAMAAALKKGMDRRDVVLSSLKLMGITAFIIDSKHASNTAEIMEHVQCVITFVGKENRTFAPTVFQRCLLYQDHDGLLYNLVLPKYTAGLASKWQEYVDSFSAFQAILAFSILLRSIPCIEEGEIDSQLKPAYLALIAGLVLLEEIGLSLTNVVMMVQACPSLSAYTVSKDSGSDWIRKCVILVLALAGIATGNAQVAFTMIALLLMCAVLLANLGARTWYFFQWQPLGYNGSFATILAYMAAIGAGFIVPFLGHRTASVGGKPALESILRLTIMLALCFVVSDFDSVQQFIVVGKEGCNQTAVNTFVGIWYSLALLVSVHLASKVQPIHEYPDEEPLLEEDHQSPVGFRVPNLPDFPIDPAQGKTGIRQLSQRIEVFIGVILAALVGAGIVALAYTGWGDATEDAITNFVNVF